MKSTYTEQRLSNTYLVIYVEHLYTYSQCMHVKVSGQVLRKLIINLQMVRSIQIIYICLWCLRHYRVGCCELEGPICYMVKGYPYLLNSIHVRNIPIWAIVSHKMHIYCYTGSYVVVKSYVVCYHWYHYQSS